MNLHRRQLTKAQLAAVALDLLPHLEAEARERQGSRTDLEPSAENGGKFGESTEKAAELVGVGKTTIKAAKAIQRKDPQVVERMPPKTGKLEPAPTARNALDALSAP